MFLSFGEFRVFGHGYGRGRPMKVELGEPILGVVACAAITDAPLNYQQPK